MKLDLHRLRHVVAVGETRSFSRAAEQLSITQPALSRSIATLEEDLGLRIFDRSRSGVFITPAGAELIAEAQRLLSQAQVMEQNLLQIRNAEAGIIKFGMAPMVASIFLPRLLHSLSTAHPGLVLRPLVRKAEELLGALTSGQVEICFAAGPHLSDSEHISPNRLGVISVGLFARASHPLALKPAPDIDDLRLFPFAASVAEFRGRGGVPLVTSIVCDNYFLMKELILSSDTVCFMSPALVREELKSGKVVRLKLELMEQSDFDLCFLHLRHRTLSPSTALLLETFQALMRAIG